MDNYLCHTLISKAQTGRPLQLLNDGEACLKSLNMQLDDMLPSHDGWLYVSLLQMCGDLKALPQGMRIHDHICKGGLQPIQIVAHSLIIMYGKCGCVKHAWAVFERIKPKNLVSWNSIISACIYAKESKEAFKLFRCMWMKFQDIMPNRVTFLTILAACDSEAVLEEGKFIHACVIDVGLEKDVAVATSLVSMYGKCGCLEFARKVFDGLQGKDLVSWNGLLTIYVQHGCGCEALHVYGRLLLQDMDPDRVTFIMVLNGCAICRHSTYGMIIHCHLIEAAYDSDLRVVNALINMHGKHGGLKEAVNTFNSVHPQSLESCNSLILVYAQQGCHKEALGLFYFMKEQGMKCNGVTYINALSSCTSSAALSDGKSIHASAITCKLESSLVVGNALLCMYSRCGSVEEAQQMFDKIQSRDLVSWNAIISAHEHHGFAEEALGLFWQMQKDGISANEFTLASVFAACASMAALHEGRMIHALASEYGHETDSVVMNAVVNMYGRSGSVEDALKVFKNMHQRTVWAWTAVISAYALQGKTLEALQIFCQMKDSGFKPTEVSFVSIISACSHEGLVDEGCHYLSSMCFGLGIIPCRNHYGCMVDLFGRAGLLDRAESIVCDMPFQPASIDWYALLCACKTYGDLERGEIAAWHAHELHPYDASACVSLFNIFALVSTWDLD